MTGWRGMLKGDPLPWLLQEEPPAVRHLALRQLLDQPEHAPLVQQARTACNGYLGHPFRTLACAARLSELSCHSCSGSLSHQLAKRPISLPRSLFSRGTQLEGGTSGTGSSRWMVRGRLHQAPQTGACLQYAFQEARWILGFSSCSQET